MKFSAVLLAGGESRRFGRDKAVYEWKDVPLWKRQLATLRETKPGELFVSAKSEPPWCPADARFIADAVPSRGPLSGLVAALSAMNGSHLLALAVDMPFMTSDFLGRLAAGVSPGCGAVPMCNHEAEPLAAIYPVESMACLKNALDHGQDWSLRGVIQTLISANLMLPLNISDGEVALFRNLNQPQDIPA